jgi:hypothetical protein
LDLVTFLGLPTHFVVLALESNAELVTLHLQSQRLAASCPLCHHEATRIHSHYRGLFSNWPKNVV